jgi:hemoglobin/transferrin/lactoferrin receptor protein
MSCAIHHRLTVCAIAITLMLPLSSAAAESDNEIAAELAPIIVRAGRLIQLQDQPTAPISVLDRNDIELRQARGLDDLLSELPGVAVSGGPRRDGLMPVIRGLSDGRVVVRLDGARQNFQRNHRSQTYLDPSLLQQVEVLRGPASTLFGSGAIGGVVDFRTIDVLDFLGPEADFGGRLSLGYQSNADEGSGALTLAGRHGDFGLLGSLSRSRSEDFVDGDGNAEPFSGSDSLSGVLKANWQLSDYGLLTASYLDFEDSSNTHSTSDRAFDPNRLPPRSVDRRSRQKTASLRYTYRPAPGGLLDLDATVYRTDLSQRDRPLDPAVPMTESELVTTGIDVFNNSYVEWLGLHQILTYGIEVYRDDQAGFSAGAPDRGFSDSEQDTIGVFIQNRLLLSDRLDLTAGLRFDRITQKEQSDQGRERSRFNELSPQLTLSYRLLDGLAAYASYAEAFRVPNLRERFIGGTHFGNNQFLPNPGLEPEKARNKELGLTYSRPGMFVEDDRLRGQISIYQNDIDNFIEQIVRRADFPDPTLADTTRFENVGEARLRGIEADLRYDHRAFYIGLVGNLLRGDDRSDDRPLEGMPADSLSLRGAILMPERSMEIGSRLTAFKRQDRLPPTTDPDALGATAGYLVTDLFLSSEIARDLRLDLRLDNVFDRGFRQAPNLIPGRGRSLKAQLSYRF